MAINTGKVVVGGFAAGVVSNVLGFLGFGLLLGPKFNAEMDAIVPGLSTKMASGMNMAIGIVSQFVIGFLMVWLYAAMRPRFGPGPKTATYAGLTIWVCGTAFYLDNWQSGMTSGMTYIMASVVMLVFSIVTANAGAWLYKEEGA